MTPMTLRDGTVVDWEVVQVILDIERRGGRFLVEGDKVRVLPVGVLLPSERPYLVAKKAEVLRILTYEADDSHLMEVERGLD